MKSIIRPRFDVRSRRRQIRWCFFPSRRFSLPPFVTFEGDKCFKTRPSPTQRGCGRDLGVGRRRGTRSFVVVVVVVAPFLYVVVVDLLGLFLFYSSQFFSRSFLIMQESRGECTVFRTESEREFSIFTTERTHTHTQTLWQRFQSR